ncbi:MAG: hypothetical protein ACLVKO_01275 [Dysgonomonas sp.]
MRNLLLVMLLFTSQLVFSQGIKVVSNEQIPISEGRCLPVLSPNGDYLLLTGDDMQGLQKYDLTTKKLTTITNDKGAGFGAQISSDGSTIVYRTSDYQGKLRYSSLKSVDVATGKEFTLIKSTRNLQGINTIEGTVLAVNDGKLVKKTISGKKSSSSVTPPVVSIKEGQLYVTNNGSIKQVSPLGKNVSYLWASVSPNGKKLLFYVVDQAKAYVSNIDGSNSVSLGTLRAPSWMGNDWVVGMLDKDNGTVVTSSKIIGIAADGTGRTELTGNSVIAMYPTASTDATKIAYNTADGKVFLMHVKTNK